MQTIATPGSAKKAANLSINSDLLSQAKALRINLSATLERALVDAIREKQRQQWLEDNQRAEVKGCFSDSLRNF